MERIIVVGALIIALAVAFMFRWTVISHDGETVAVFRLDRWTGAMTVCLPFECRNLQERLQPLPGSKSQ
jgi:hypothetical protein